MAMLVQIYEIQDAAEAEEMCKLGVDHVGLLVGGGTFPREIPVSQARTILKAVAAPAKKVALTLSRNLAEIENIVNELYPDILHLGSLLTGIRVEDMFELRRVFPHIKMMRSIPVTGPESIHAAEEFASVSDYLLLDSYQITEEQIGATGMVHDWMISREIVGRVKIPVILAGGLGPENVRDAIRAVHPAGVDSKTRTDRDGTHRKDPDKVKRFVELAKSDL
jgi:phosphoribosylanthranilate isomerase